MGNCFYFLRPNNEKAVTVSSISNDVVFGQMDATGGKILEGFENMLAKVMLPALQVQEVTMTYHKTEVYRYSPRG